MPHRARDTRLRIRNSNSPSLVIPGCALLGAGPESITTIGGYGFRARAQGGAPRNDGAWSMSYDLRHPCRRRGVAAALGADKPIDNGHADAGQVAEPHALE